jgi:diguanylate cyclase (GGDEF)-like protein
MLLGGGILMPEPRDEQAQPWPTDPDAPEPTVALPAWPEHETTLRRREQGEGAPPAPEAVLVVYAGPHLGRVYPLAPGVNVIGRSPSADLSLADEEVSRVHAWVTLRGTSEPEAILEDRGSTNGTYLNDRRIAGPTRLAPGDRIAMGNQVLKLVHMDALERAFHAVLLDQSTRDTLTGLANRRAVLEELQGRFDLSRRHRRPLAILMCDLDHFKQINDTLGHGAGDLVLQEFGQRIRETLRTTDVAGRIGGEEFLVIAPETDLEGARLLAERLRLAAAGQPFQVPRTLRVTCSLGVAQRTQEDRDAGALLARADRALYAAKRAGRNQVVADPL